MKVSNIVVSTVAALSMASVLGIAYAQSNYSDPQTGTTNRTGTLNEQDATGTTNQGSTNMDSSSTSRSQPAYNARLARADRN